MNNSNLNIRLIHFNRWTRKNWAAFASLGKIIKISFLTAGLCSITLAQKAEAQSHSTNEPDTIRELEQVEVTGELTPELYSELSRMVTVIMPSQIEQSPVNSINDLLASLSQVDLRQRGFMSVQADVAIRGSNFDQVLILLNGVSINNPQTGHHNLDLPISIEEIERIEVLSGPASRVYGPDAYSGAINIITKKSDKNQIGLSSSIGNFGLKTFGVNISLKKNNFGQYFSIGTEGSTGYLPNTDFQNSRLYYNANLDFKKSSLNFQTSAGTKNFGAASFYTPKYPDQFESTQKGFASLTYTRKAKINLQSTAFYKTHIDKFELFRIEEEAPSWYKNHNYHFTQSFGVNNKVFIYSKIGKTSVGINYRFSDINSNVLGKSTNDTIKAIFWKEGFYTKHDSRSEISIFAEQVLNLKNWRIAAGFMSNHLTNQNNLFNYSPGIDLAYRINLKSRIFGSFNTSMRQPTFTDLYYQGPSNIGNLELTSETSTNYEIGYHFSNHGISFRISSFYTLGKNTIDWVRLSDTLKWQPMNISETKQFGVESAINWTPEKNSIFHGIISNMRISYNWQNSNHNSGEYQSNYIDDYIRNKVNFEISNSIGKRIKTSLSYSYIDRMGTFFLYDAINKKEFETEFGSHNLFNFIFKYLLKSGEIYLSILNIFNEEYYDYGNIPSPKRWISIGFNYSFNY